MAGKTGRTLSELAETMSMPEFLIWIAAYSEDQQETGPTQSAFLAGDAWEGR